jgi:hypothetical protein
VRIGNLSQFGLVLLLYMLDINEPLIEQTQLPNCHGRLHAPALIMTAYDHVPDLKHFHRILYNAQDIQIAGHNQVGDVSVHEHFARVGAGNFIRRYPTIGAANPQEFGFLVGRQRCEIIVIGFQFILNPGFVLEQ